MIKCAFASGRPMVAPTGIKVTEHPPDGARRHLYATGRRGRRPLHGDTMTRSYLSRRVILLRLHRTPSLRYTPFRAFFARSYPTDKTDGSPWLSHAPEKFSHKKAATEEIGRGEQRRKGKIGFRPIFWKGGLPPGCHGEFRFLRKRASRFAPLSSVTLPEKGSGHAVIVPWDRTD